MRRLLWSGGQSFDGSSDQTPVLVINGMGKGPTLCLTGAIHGDELNGIEIVRRVTQDLEPARMHVKEGTRPARAAFGCSKRVQPHDKPRCGPLQTIVTRVDG